MKNKLFKIFVCVALAATLLTCAFAFTACNDEEKDIVFKFDGEGTKIMGKFPYGVLSSLVIDDENSYFTLGKDGYVHARIQTMDVAKLLKGNGSELENPGLDLPSTGGALADMAGGIDLNSFADSYLKQMFPGFTFDDIERSLGLLGSLGFGLSGLDFSNQKIIDLVKFLKNNNGVTPKNMHDYIPDTLALAITLDCKYEFKDLKDADGKSVRALYIGEYNPLSQPFAVMTVTDVKGKMRLSARIEFIQFDIVADQI